MRALRPLIALALAGCSVATPLAAEVTLVEPVVARTLAPRPPRHQARQPEPVDPSPPPETLLAVPDGFPQSDEFSAIEDACEALTPRLVEREDLRAPILEWCLRRAWASSRNGVVRSRLDGSWIHDRDRPAAYAFYRSGLKSGAIDPETCEHHTVDTDRKRTRDEQSFPDRWPYGTHCDQSQGECRPASPGHMLEDVADRWLDHAPDYERFGSRGPMDNHFATAARLLPGCYGPEVLDRFDVSAAVVIERSIDLCERLEDRLDTRVERQRAKARGLPTRCRTAKDLRAVWHPRFWYSSLRGI